MSVLVDQPVLSDVQIQSITKDQESLENRVSILWQRLCLLKRKELFRQCSKTARDVSKAVSEFSVPETVTVKQEPCVDEDVDVESPCLRPLSKSEHTAEPNFSSCASAACRVQECCRGFRAQVRTVCRSLDSDGTESSSGGESDDELEIPPKKRLSQPGVTAQRVARAEYEAGRAQIASKMNWLCSQIADLDHRIRYQGEMIVRHRSIHRPLRYPSHHSRRFSVSSTSSQTSVTSQDNDLSSTSGPAGGENWNSGVPNSKPGGEHAARCHAVPAMSKRKLYRCSKPSYGVLEQLPQWEASSWLNDVYDPSAVTDASKSAHAPTIMEQLDRSYHPVLSFHSDIPSSVCLENSIRHQQHEAPSLQPPCSIRRSSFQHAKKQRAARLKHLARESGRASPIIRPVKRSSHGAVITASSVVATPGVPVTPSPAVSKRSADGSRRPKGITLSDPSHSYSTRTPLRRTDSGASITPTASTPGSGPLSRQQSQSATRRQKRATSSTSYDINSIVVQLAAPSRVEKIHYKEIATPRWRECDVLCPEPVPVPVAAATTPAAACEAEEDLSDEAFRLRHLRMEALERNRFQGTDKKKRTRASVGSSMPTTPDTSGTPTSPATATFLGGRSGDISTVNTPQEEGAAAPVSSRKSSRKVAVLSRSVSSNAEPELTPTPVVVWERRVFPLTDAEVEELKDDQPVTRSHSAASCGGSLSPSFIRAQSMPASLSCSRAPSNPASPPVPCGPVKSGTTPSSPRENWSVRLPSPAITATEPEEGSKPPPLLIKLTKQSSCLS